MKISAKKIGWLLHLLWKQRDRCASPKEESSSAENEVAWWQLPLPLSVPSACCYPWRRSRGRAAVKEPGLLLPPLFLTCLMTTFSPKADEERHGMGTGLDERNEEGLNTNISASKTIWNVPRWGGSG